VYSQRCTVIQTDLHARLLLESHVLTDALCMIHSYHGSLLQKSCWLQRWTIKPTSHVTVNTSHVRAPLYHKARDDDQSSTVYLVGALGCKLSSSYGIVGAVFGVAGALAVFHCRHGHMLGQRSSSVLQSLGTSLDVNLKIGLLCPLIDSW